MNKIEQMAWDRVKSEFPNIGWWEALDMFDDLVERTEEHYHEKRCASARRSDE